jgi:hypothetical protein
VTVWQTIFWGGLTGVVLIGGGLALGKLVAGIALRAMQ